MLFIVLFIVTLLTFSTPSPVPGKKARIEREKYSQKGAEKELRFYPSDSDSYLAEYHSNRVGDVIHSHPNKIEHGLAKVGLSTDQHDMDWGRWGKPQTSTRIKQPYWYVREWGQKKAPPPAMVHENLPKAKQLGMQEESNVGQNGNNVAIRKQREPRKVVPPTTSKRNSRSHRA